MNQKFEQLKEILKNDALRVADSQNFDYLSNKSILVTGANGLIGTNFITSLIEISKNINGIKIFPVFHSSPSKLLNSIIINEKISIFKGDLTNEEFLNSLPKVDIIIHAAGSGIPINFLQNKLSCLKINTLTTLKLFEHLNPNGRFLFISSSDIYNGLDNGAYTEDQIGTTNTNHSRACYIEGKRTGETICHIYREKGINAYAVRLSLTYGPGISYDDKRVLPSFIRKAIENRTIQMLDNGEATRTFCYISDAIELMWHIILNGKYCVYNVSGCNNQNIKFLANTIGNLTNTPVHYPKIETGILGAPSNVNINNSRVINESLKKDFVDLKTGLINTINWMTILKNS